MDSGHNRQGFAETRQAWIGACTSALFPDAHPKIDMVNSLNETVRTLILDGIQQPHPEATSEQVRRERFMTMQGEATRITLLVAQTLERTGVPYAVGGSPESSLHAVMRSTLNVDIVADVRAEHIPALAAALSIEF